jgi:DNA-binding MurR/RpiR family transcriptional regulator
LGLGSSLFLAHHLKYFIMRMQLPYEHLDGPRAFHLGNLSCPSGNVF